MPDVRFQGETIACDEGENLRDVLLRADLSPHKGIAKRLNCGGNATCGTCAIRIVEGPVRQDEQATRLRLARHDRIEEVRLACQYEVTDDLLIERP